jgi:hypothetical protein
VAVVKPGGAVAAATIVLAFALSLFAAPAALGSGYTITATCSSAGTTAPCSAGWYTSAVVISWSWAPDNDGSNPTSGCLPHAYAKDASTAAACTVSGPLGITSVTVPIHVEISSPVATSAPTRAPDSGGWYNHAVTIAFSGQAFSGIAACTTATYSGPSSASATVTGSCTDNAGKTVQATSAPFAFDAGTPPLGMTAETGDRITVLDWRLTDIAPAAGFELLRQPGLHGKRPSVLYRGLRTSFTDRHVDNGVRYQYTVKALDAAGNGAVQALTVRPGRRLLSPAPGAAITAPPLLRWTAVRGASYYNVQLLRDGHKVLSTWPVHSSLQLDANWRFAGHRFSLRPGTYRWYVWPGFGKRSAARYGHRIGTSTFSVQRGS